MHHLSTNVSTCRRMGGYTRPFDVQAYITPSRTTWHRWCWPVARPTSRPVNENRTRIVLAFMHVGSCVSSGHTRTFSLTGLYCFWPVSPLRAPPPILTTHGSNSSDFSGPPIRFTQSGIVVWLERYLKDRGPLVLFPPSANQREYFSHTFDPVQKGSGPL